MFMHYVKLTLLVSVGAALAAGAVSLATTLTSK